METTSTFIESILETLEVSSSTSSSIRVAWEIPATIAPFVEAYRVHYQKLESTYIQYGKQLSPSQTTYEIQNLVADTYYKVCLVVYRNDSLPMRECMGASTTNWQLPVSIGSSIGAILALTLIVFIVLLSRCQIPVHYRHKKRKHSSHYNNMSSNFQDDHYDFSETNTHPNEEDYTSVFEQEDDPHLEIFNDTGHRKDMPIKCSGVQLPLRLTQGHVYPISSQPRQQDMSLRTPLSRAARMKHFVRANSLQNEVPPCSPQHVRLKERRCSLAVQCSLISHNTSDNKCSLESNCLKDRDNYFCGRTSEGAIRKKTSSQGFGAHGHPCRQNSEKHLHASTIGRLQDSSDKMCVFEQSFDFIDEVASPAENQSVVPLTKYSSGSDANIKRLPCLLSEDIHFGEFSAFHETTDGSRKGLLLHGAVGGAKPKQLELKPKLDSPPVDILSQPMYEEHSL